MRVELMACTHLAGKPDDYQWHDNEADADELAEMAGRLCYKSWGRPNPATATNEGYLRNIISQGHFSVLEHASATFWISGVSRSLTHELVRHRHLSFSQVSQRYVDESEAEMVIPKAVMDSNISDYLEDVGAMAREGYEMIADQLIFEGFTRKEARQAARSVLPNATETEIIVTGNHRAWRDVIQKRNSPHADAEIRELAQELLRQLKELAPHTYGDME